jgi:hypothetical protein
MDIENPLHTAGTYRLVRAEQIALMLVCGALMLWHRDQLSWWRAFWAFWIIDIVGYLPGAVAYRRRKHGPIPAFYHHIYNFAHTYLVVGAGVAVWAWHSGFEWAMLAVPFHLAIDRGVFGNVFKPVALPFEPAPMPELWSGLMGGPRRGPNPAELPASMPRGWQP